MWRSVGGPLAWSDEMHLLAEVEHAARLLLWAQTKDAQSGRNAPKRLEPPDKPVSERREAEDTVRRRAAAHVDRRRKQERELGQGGG